ncbi:MAG: hypothetical protein F2736_05620 [Actinobacteria bacterium]|nr:hypothetical protein [Actinomycetota bacterium]
MDATQIVMGITALMLPRNRAMKWRGIGHGANTVSTLLTNSADCSRAVL